MSRIFGEIRQFAFVVPDIDVAMDYWANILGVGPFFIKRRITLNNFIYRGEPAASPTISIALANSGAIQIEIIQQHDALPSIYRDFLAAGRQGLQHVSSWLTRDEFDTRKKSLLAAGFTLAQEGIIPSSGVRLAYFDTERNGGLVFEMSDLREPGQYERVMRIQQAASEWQGHNPVIEVSA